MKAQSVGRTLARRWWMLPIIIGGIWWPALAQDPVSAWEAQYRKVLEAYRSGSYRDAIPIAQQALSLARHAFGERDIRTVNTMIRTRSAAQRSRPLWGG